MIIAAKAHDNHNDTAPVQPHLGDSASLRLEMRASFHEINERLKLLDMEHTALLSKFDALLALVAESLPQRR